MKRYLRQLVFFTLFFFSTLLYGQTNDYVIPDGKFLTIGTYSNSNESKGITFTGFRDVVPNYFGASIEVINDWVCCNGYPNGGYPGIKHIGLNFNFHKDVSIASDKFTAMSILSTGNIGIGNSNPQTKLDIATDDNQKIMLAYQNKSSISFIPNNGNSWFHISHGLNNDLAISQGSNIDDGRLLTIKNNGNVAVNGKFEAKEVKVTTTPTADFVFGEDYSLPKLEEVEKHIKEKKHLPEIAPAKEMEKEGVNIGKFQIKLLQKIEELTLYSIQLNKENKELKNSSEEQEKLIKLLIERVEKLESNIK